MKLYEKYVPIMVHRLNIFEKGKQTVHIAFTNTTMEEVQKFVVSLLPPKIEDKKIIVQIRENKGGDNGKSKNITIHGYSAEFFKLAIYTRLKLNSRLKSKAMQTKTSI